LNEIEAKNHHLKTNFFALVNISLTSLLLTFCQPKGGGVHHGGFYSMSFFFGPSDCEILNAIYLEEELSWKNALKS
jgi:hypothetical protein